jgi:hypothetical protein
VDVVVACEVVYDEVDPKLLASTLWHLLKRPHGVAYVVVVTEGRGRVGEFDKALEGLGFNVIKQPLGAEALFLDKREEAELAVVPSQVLVYVVKV